MTIANSNFTKLSSHSKQGWTEVLDRHTSNWAGIMTMEKYTSRHLMIVSGVIPNLISGYSSDDGEMSQLWFIISVVLFTIDNC